MKDIKGYEGDYAITSCGKVWSIKSGKFLKLGENKDGYLRVGLRKKGKYKNCLVHRLVAEAYIENQNNYPQVNHKDENKTNNCVNNLEWCDAKYNNSYGTRIESIKEKVGKKVVCLELNIAFRNAAEASRKIKVGRQHISQCCSGTRKTAGGYHWKYA